MPHVARQHPTASAEPSQPMPDGGFCRLFLLPVVLLQVRRHAVKGEVYAFTALTCAIVVDKAPRNAGIKHRVAKRPLELPVAQPRGYNVPHLGFADGETLVAAQLVAAVQQLLPQPVGVGKRIVLISCRAGLPAHATAALLQRLVKRAELYGFIELFSHVLCRTVAHRRASCIMFAPCGCSAAVVQSCGLVFPGCSGRVARSLCVHCSGFGASLRLL